MNDILKKFNSLKIDKPHLNDVLHVFIFNFFKNEEQITILLKNDANQTIFKEFNIFLYKKLIYVLERTKVVKTIGIPIDIICSFFCEALANWEYPKFCVNVHHVNWWTLVVENKNRTF